MAEIKNNFVQSRMNKDLDARLVPPGEYRDAINVAISKSDGESVGALENILGNNLLTTFGITGVDNVDVIGTYMDVVNDRIIVFMTNYIDTSSDYLSNFASSDSLHYIGVYNIATQVAKLVVSGYFLNFSKTHEIYGINLIDDLLFWTDHRNQPRKINISTAWSNNSYYTNEDHISVAKYYPYEPIDLVKKEVVDWVISYTGTPWNNSYSAPSYNLPTSGGSGSGLTVDILSIETDGTLDVITINNTGIGYLDGDVLLVDGKNGDATITLEVEIISTMQDVVSDYLPNGITPNPLRQPYGDILSGFDPSTWQGDPTYLKDKFVRFSYRFKFDDGEYSLIAPFTQECFVPEQDGYFIYTDNAYPTPKQKRDEDSTFKSTEVSFMQNKINNIILILNSPVAGGWGQVADGLKITEIDILYKQADQATIRIADTIDATTFSAEPTDFLEYNYQSRKPWKTLPSSELLRVYDQVPVKALAQEVSGNRVIYANYIDKHTPPATLNYCLNATDKIDESAGTTNLSGQPRATRKEYQNHTLKRNRTYQVGVVLSDRYGRQSTVILSEIDTPTEFEDLKGSTLFHPFWDYNGAGSFGEFPAGSLIATSTTWPGDSLQATFIDTITSTKSSLTGEPGMYQPLESVNNIGFSGPNGSNYVDGVNIPTTGGTGTGLTVNITTAAGAITAVTINNPGSNYTIGDIVTIFRQPIPIAADGIIEITGLNTPNPLGWCSFKMVVKQAQQEYYNVYFPGILNGYISGESANPTTASANEPIVHFVMHSDNINKIPRDLSLVGPTQLSFRTGRPTPSEDPSYYQFTDPTGNAFAADPFSEEGEKLLKDRDRARDLDSGSQITNASVKLIPRVQNFGKAIGYGGGGVALSYPGRISDVVTAIATGPELGLWDPAAKTPYNTASAFYGYKNNPYVAKVVVGDYGSRIDNSVAGQFGAIGPSTSSTMLRYSSSNNVTGPPPPGPVGGWDYTAGSKNLRATPDETMSGEIGIGVLSTGKGILFDVTLTDNTILTSGEPGHAGSIVNGGVQLANPDDKEISGYGNWDYLTTTNPKDVLHLLHGGSIQTWTNVRITSQELFGDMVPGLAIYEVEPLESKLDIYWETSTSGLISELNSLITSTNPATPVSFSTGSGYPAWVQYENYVQNINVTQKFWPTDSTGALIAGVVGPNSYVIGSLSVIDGNGVDRSTEFYVLDDPGGTDSFEIYQDSYFYYGFYAHTTENYTVSFDIKTPSATHASDGTFITTTMSLDTNCQLQNVQPIFTNCPAGIIHSNPDTGDYLSICESEKVYIFHSENGANSAASSLNTLELKYEIVDQKVVTPPSAWSCNSLQGAIAEWLAPKNLTPFSIHAYNGAMYHDGSVPKWPGAWMYPGCQPEDSNHSLWDVHVKVTDASGTGLIGNCHVQVLLHGAAAGSWTSVC